jgi:hypothetical protein
MFAGPVLVMGVMESIAPASAEIVESGNGFPPTGIRGFFSPRANWISRLLCTFVPEWHDAQLTDSNGLIFSVNIAPLDSAAAAAIANTTSVPSRGRTIIHAPKSFYRKCKPVLAIKLGSFRI